MSTQNEASEVAHVLAGMVPTLPEDVARDLHVLLALNLGAPTSAALRESRLGLVIEMIQTGGEVPKSSDYDALRQQRNATGEDWPDRATLNAAFGGWTAVVRAAMRHFHEKRVGKASVPADYNHGRKHPVYSRAEILIALEQCRDALGPWPSDDAGPTEPEYMDWARLSRRASRLAGLGYPRLPGREQIRKKFGDYSRAADDARWRRLAGMSMWTADQEEDGGRLTLFDGEDRERL